MSDRFSDIFAAANQLSQDGQVEPDQDSKPTKKTKKSEAIGWDDLILEKEEIKRLNLDIPLAMDKKLATRAKKLKITKSALVRKLIDSYLENIE